MKGSVKIFLVSLAAVLSAAVFLGCGQQTGSNPQVIEPRTGVYAYLGTQSPGDAWSWVISPGSVIGTNETLGKYYAGNYTAYASGFNKMVITDTNDTSVPTDGSAVGYFLEYPNTMLIVGGGDDRVIVCAAKATTAPGAGPYNFVNIPWMGWSSGDDAYGTVEVTESGGSYSFDVRTYDLSGAQVGASQEAGFTFSDGRLSKAGNPLQIFMTPSGCYMGDSGPGNGGFAGAAKQAANVAEACTKQYRGVLFAYDPGTGGGETMAVGAEPHPTLSNALWGYSFDDVELNTRRTGGVTLEFGAQQDNGILNGTMTHDNGAVSAFKMVVSQVSSKYIVFGIATDGAGYPQNFLVVEQ